MKVAIFVGHPAHYHLFKNMANDLVSKGHKVEFLVKRKDIVEDLVKKSGFPFFIVRKEERKGASKFHLIMSLLKMDFLVSWYKLKHSPDVLLGTYSPIVSRFIGCPTFVCNEDDADVVPRFAKIAYPGATEILVPSVCDCGKWNGKAVKYESFQELAYLHPKNFTPDKAVVEKYFTTDTPYCIIRFAKLNAHHDGGIKGITPEIAQKIIDILKPTMRVYITSERELESQFEPYRIHIDTIDMHHVMAFAGLYIGDSQTMAAEAGVLGVPFVRFNGFVGRIGYLRDLEDNYHLGYGVKPNEIDRLYKTIGELVEMPNRKEVFSERRKLMLSEKIDYAAFLTWFVENYPLSKKEIMDNPNFQLKFK